MPSKSTEQHREIAARQGPVPLAIITVSDTRTRENDTGGDLIEQRAMLQARLSMLKGQRAGLESMLESGSRSVEKIEDLERKLAENEGSLAEFPGAAETLDYVMKRARSVLTHAADHIEVRPVRLRLDHMNILLPQNAGTAATEIVLPEILVKHVPQIHLVVGRFPRSELIRRDRLFDEARRLLG